MCACIPVLSINLDIFSLLFFLAHCNDYIGLQFASFCSLWEASYFMARKATSLSCLQHLNLGLQMLDVSDQTPNRLK